MPEYLSFPYPVSDIDRPAGDGPLQYRVPVAGIETANKVLDRLSAPSNEMFTFTTQNEDY